MKLVKSYVAFQVHPINDNFMDNRSFWNKSHLEIEKWQKALFERWNTNKIGKVRTMLMLCLLQHWIFLRLSSNHGADCKFHNHCVVFLRSDVFQNHDRSDRALVIAQLPDKIGKGLLRRKFWGILQGVSNHHSTQRFRKTETFCVHRSV